jgi:hypothetical protein
MPGAAVSGHRRVSAQNMAHKLHGTAIKGGYILAAPSDQAKDSWNTLRMSVTEVSDFAEIIAE